LPFPWNFVTLPAEDRATAIGNIHTKKLAKVALAGGSGDILADRQTDRQTQRHTQTYSSQYFATAPAGEVMTTTISNINTTLLQ